MGIGFPLQHIPANRSAYTSFFFSFLFFKETRIYGTEKARDRGGGEQKKETETETEYLDWNICYMKSEES